jgi:hypothetical protein
MSCQEGERGIPEKSGAFVLHQGVHVTLRREVVAEDGAKQGQPADAVTAAGVGDLLARQVEEIRALGNRGP